MFATNPVAYLTFLPNVGDALFNLVDKVASLRRDAASLRKSGNTSAAEAIDAQVAQLVHDADVRARTEWTAEEIAEAKREVDAY